MLFGQIIESSIDIGDVAPTKYRANLEGALMLVYENECNYTAMMKSVGLSEMKYYMETGKDLFVHEAGAFGGFIEKAKNFFKKVLEKIKALFKKFFMTISSYVQSDKTFAKKYEKDILRATNLDDFEFKGWKFNNGELDNLHEFKSKTADNALDLMTGDITLAVTTANTIKADSTSEEIDAATALARLLKLDVKNSDSDTITNIKEAVRGELVDKGSLDEEEFKQELFEKYYGDSNKEKEILEDSDIDLRKCLSIIRETNDNIKGAQKVEKASTKAISKIIKALDDANKDLAKVTDDEKVSSSDTDATRRTKSEKSSAKQNAIKIVNWVIDILRSLSNDITVMCGIQCEALKDRNRQAKAMCIKAVSYSNKKKAKNESAYYGSSNNEFNGLFDFDIK